MSRPLTATELGAMYGKSARYFQKLAKAGKLPFASQPGGPGTAIYFDPDGIDEWMRKGKLGRAKWPTSTGATDGRGRARRSREWKDANPLELVLKQKLKSISNSSSQR